ncbi:hypothetical protein LOTGIDRAFT_163822 [Lottia gigantea]|uniref:Glutamate receptor n=1 Tax=Lottia gigantea TaxID=225164 RepID=V4ABE4_LOTGI|nr:hypothetical protein LOTGIDRAFT_163822 [Lottia gigantea]ESO90626.1 hypothetical protein LOTGIDRAFT_163822 [Lottia gigantea]
MSTGPNPRANIPAQRTAQNVLPINVCRQMSEGVFAIIGQKTMQTADIVQAFTTTFHMPYLTPSLSRDTIRKHSKYELHMKPDFTQALIEMISFLEWDHVHYLYDSDEGMIRLQKMFKSMRNASIAWFNVKRFNDIHHVHEDLRQIDRGDINATKSFVLDLSSEEAYKIVLKQIPEVGMNKYGYNYLLGTLDFKSLNLSRYRHGGVNITGFQLIDDQNSDNREYYREMKKMKITSSGFDRRETIPSSAALIVDAVLSLDDAIESMLDNDTDVFRYTFRRKHVYNYNRTRGVPCTTDPPTPWMHGNTIYKLLRTRKPPGVSGQLTFDKKGFRQDYKLGVYTVNLETGPYKLGTWSSGIGFRSIYDGSRDKNRHGYRPLNNSTTKVITSILSPPFLMEQTHDDDGTPLIGNDRFSGYAKDLSDHIAKLLGFEYEIRLVKDRKYGSKNPKTKEWNGMIGELIRHEAHLAVAPLTITADRERNVDFSKPFMNIGISIMIRQPDKQKPGVFSFMEPLSFQIWMCIIVAYVGVSVGLFLVSRFSPVEWKKTENGLESFRNEFSLMNSFWFSMGALMFQGSDACPRSISGRIIGGVWWFFVLITISSYTANLAAFLTIERMLTPIESADDLSKQTEIKYGMITSGTTKEFFKNSAVATYARMWNYMSTTPDVMVESIQEGIDKVRNSKGKYAFLIESSNNDYVNNRKPCNTMKVGPNLNSKGFGIATPRGSDMRDKITLAVLTLKEDGTLHTLHRRWWYEKGECGMDGGSKDTGKQSLSLSNVAGVFYILISGLVFSILLGVFEVLYYRRNNMKGTYLRGTETSQTIVSSTPNERPVNDDRALPYENYNNDKFVSEYTYSAPGTIGFDGFNRDGSVPIGFEGYNRDGTRSIGFEGINGDNINTVN